MIGEELTSNNDQWQIQKYNSVLSKLKKELAGVELQLEMEMETL